MLLSPLLYDKRKILNLVNNGVLFAHSDLSFVEYLFEEEVNGIESEINNGIAHVRIDDLLYFGTDERAVQSYVSLLKDYKKMIQYKVLLLRLIAEVGMMLQVII
jgi:hypothetical protein